MDPITGKKKKKKQYSEDVINAASDQVTTKPDQSQPLYGQFFGLHPALPQLTTQVLQHGADPKALDAAFKMLGSGNFKNLCEAFLETVKGKAQHFASAIDAWDKQQGKAVHGTAGIQPGDAIYFSANQGNGGYGHTGVYAGNGQFVSATPNGVKELPVNDWTKATGQKVLGYIPS